MSEFDTAKLRAAEAAAELVEPGMIVGLGTGTTASAMVRHLGDRNGDGGPKRGRS